MTGGPYKLPEGWRWVRLGEVIRQSFSGGTPSTKVKSYWDGDLPWTTSATIGEDDIFLTRYLRTITSGGLEGSATKVAPKGSLVVATRVGVGKAAVTTFDVAISQDLTALILDSVVHAMFLAYLFKSPLFKIGLSGGTRGTTIRGITRRALLGSLIPLPPLEEQRRIVMRIEALMECIREARRLREEARREADRLWQSVLAETFPCPGSDLPEGWRWVRLGEVCLPTEKLNPAKNPSAPFIYVDISSIDNGVGEIVSPKQLRGKDAPSRARKVIKTGDVLFATTRPYLKNIAIVRPDLDDQICSTGFCIVRADWGKARPDYLFHLLCADFFTEQLSERKMRGASYPAVTDGDVLEAFIPLPPLEEQHHIVAHLEAVRAYVQALKKAQDDTEVHLKELERSILDKAFRGEL